MAERAKKFLIGGAFICKVSDEITEDEFDVNLYGYAHEFLLSSHHIVTGISIWDHTYADSNEIEWFRSYARRVGHELYICQRGGIRFELRHKLETVQGMLMRGDMLFVPQCVWSSFMKEGSAIVLSDQAFHTKYYLSYDELIDITTGCFGK